ncbi:hypothetical protein J2X54_000186 [Duganella sp. 3397]|uniref:hypothetical protein n=1 Tax=Duganella sp. 3397 TaxID=2817732 RepID=UPI0028606835|nr:hypothetical protein [Duganella sp. 3397]MDR7047751.1 hypothetical protein [Duganella sp. 3397]
MQHLHTFETEEEAEDALLKLVGQKRLASDRDGTEVIYKLFGELTWRNLYALGLHNLPELKSILSQRDSKDAYDKNRHLEIIAALENISRVLGLTIPAHWR